MDETEIQSRGWQAENLLKSPIMGEVLSKLDEIYVGAWREGKTVEAREDAHRYVALLKRFHDDIAAIAREGKVSRQREKELEGRKRLF